MKFTNNLENPFFSISEIFLVVFVATIRSLTVYLNLDISTTLEVLLIPLSIIIIILVVVFEVKKK